MPITPTYGANSTVIQNAAASQPNDGVMGENDFLNMLVAQLNYQDPMNPMDSQQFAAQLAQFTSVEQLTSINQNLQYSTNLQLLLNQSISNTMNAQLIGIEATAVNDIVMYEDGAASPIMYNLPGVSQYTTLKIYNSDGTVVKSEELGPLSVGDHSYTWDGKNNLGAAVPEGEYTFEITAKSAEGNDLAVEQFIVGIITGIEYQDGNAVFKIGEVPINLSNVTELNQPPEG